MTTVPAKPRPANEAAPEHERTPAGPEELPPPTGTIFILTLYIALLAAIWGGMYLTMLGR